MEQKQEHIRRLAAELLDDVELSRLGAESLLLKAMRLARLSGSDEVRQWLNLEMGGYNSTGPVSLKYMGQTGRWISRAENKGYWGPLAQQEARIDALKVQLTSFTTQGLGGDVAIGAINTVSRNATAVAHELSRISGIKSCVLGLLHGFVAGVYYEGIFSTTAESIFEQFRVRVDPLLQAAASDLSDRMATAYTHVGEGDQEAVSAALNTSRRVIDAFADAVFPPRDAPVEMDGQALQVGPSHHLNRINVFIATRSDSRSRRKRLRQSLANLYDRVSAGIHDDVDVDEAQALVLSTYTVLGEIALLRGDGEQSKEPTVEPPEVPVVDAT